jgi:UDP-N-acetylglucosamine 2-epimerase (non-hydrolysing)
MQHPPISLVASNPDAEPDGLVSAHPRAGGTLYHVLADAEDAPRAAAVSWAVAACGAFDQRVVDITGAAETAAVLHELEAAAAIDEFRYVTRSHVQGMGEVLDHAEPMFPERPGVAVVYSGSDLALVAAIGAARRSLPVLWVTALRDVSALNRSLLLSLVDVVLATCDEPELAAPAALRVVGDPMFDAVRRHARDAAERRAWRRFDVKQGAYVLVSVARADDSLADTVTALARRANVLVQLPSRSRDALWLRQIANAKLAEPGGFVDQLSLVRGAAAVVSDSQRLIDSAAAFGIRALHVDQRRRTRTPLDLAKKAACARLEAAGAADRIARAIASSYAPMQLVGA